MHTHIRVPIDGSPTSDCGLDEAVELAQSTGAGDAEQIVRHSTAPALLVRAAKAPNSANE